ncbi:MAG TPA: FAD-binding oxidoreductase, partial [Jatrophihabitans sp.]|nr:FAD-binding oxidoreductase [Jatrophihabitans sp.]
MQPTRPRFCIAGGGIAGALLAWRLARHGGSSVTLLDDPAEPGATAVSGGLARGYEPDRHNAQLATRSLAELAGSDRLPQLRRTGSVYVCQGAPDRATVAGIGRAVGGVSVAGPDELAGRFGLAGVPSGCLAVVERQAGYLSPAQLAAAARQQAARLGVRLRSGRLAGCESSRDGVWYVLADGRVGRADGLVLATGAWTPGLLAAAGLPANGLRTKLIRYTEFAAKGQLPPAFVDEPTGLYGRPTAD